MSARRTLTLVAFLFVFLTAIPFFLSLGAGFDFRWGPVSIRLHSAGRLFGFFFLATGILFAAWPRFREGLLAATRDYDALTHRSLRRCEFALLGGLVLWLGFLKVWQCRHLLTTCWDHGIYLNVMYNLAHGNGFWSSFRYMNFLGDHFNLILAPLALPLRWFNWASWPLIAQTVAMVGAIGLLLELAWKDHVVAPFERLVLALFFANHLYFQTVHAFDMHPIAFAPLAWIFAYLLAKRGYWKSYFVALPFLLFTIQEDVSLMLLGLGIYLACDRRSRSQGIVTAVLSLVAFVVHVKILIPHFAGPTVYMARYQSMGGSLGGIAQTLLLHPEVPLRLLFVEGHVWPLLKILATVAFAPLMNLPLALAMLPPIAQHTFSDYIGQYGYGYHYSSNLLPFLMMGVVLFLSKRSVPRQGFIPIACLGFFWFGLRAPQYMVPRDPQLVQATWQLAALTPRDVPVSVQNSLGIPFSFRRQAYRFPDIRDARLIVLSPHEKPYPLTAEEFARETSLLNRDGRWEKTEWRGLLVYKKS